jgi:myo-inositol-1(or 4)-monophosphatase
MDQPFTRERFWGHARIARMRGPDGKLRRLRTRGCSGLAEAVLTSTAPELFASREDRAGFARVKARARMTRYGGDCYGYCLLAAGHVDVVIETGLKPHDIVALIPIIEGAGGRVTTWDGRPAMQGGRILAAGDARVHAETIALLKA